MKRITIKDLALELGISDRAVSAALNPRETKVKLKPETVERIRKLADERNYRPDVSARSMRSGRFYNIGYFEASHSNVHYPLLGAEAGICDAASEQGYRVTLVKIPSDLSPGRNSIPSVFREAHLDALIVSHLGNLPDAYKEAMDASTFPIVYLNEKRPQNAVYVDDFGSAHELTNTLIRIGYDPIVFLGVADNQDHYSTRDRAAGYREAMAASGMAPQVSTYEQFTEGEVSKWRSHPSRLPAFVCLDDSMALRIFGMLYRMNLRVPEHAAIAGFGGDRDFPISLTTMRIPFYEMAREALLMSIGLISGGAGARVDSLVLKTTLTLGETTQA